VPDTPASTAVPQAGLHAGSPTLWRHVRETLALGLPVMAARCGLVIMMTVGTVMSGHAGANELAYYAIGMTPQLTMFAVGIGLLVGTTVLCAQADGAGRPEQCGRIWRLGLIAGLVLSLVYVAVQSAGVEVMLLLGQGPEIAQGGGRVLQMFAPGMPAILMYVATGSFLEGIRRPRPGMIVVLGANVVNAALCWVLVFGHLGAPAMGAAGAALAMSITRWLMLIALVVYVLTMRGHERYGVRAPLAGHWRQMRKLLMIGLPLAGAIGLESTAFTMTANFAGWLGAAPLAAYQVGVNVLALVYMLTIGMSTATAVRVANAIGRSDQRAMGHAGWTGLALILVVTLGTALVLAVAAEPIVGLYTPDPTVIALAVPIFALVGIMTIADGAQGVLMGALRGTGDVLIPGIIYGLAFWAVSVPMGYGLAIMSGHGLASLFWSLFAGLVVASLLLALRFRAVSRHLVKPL
jgi:multidrug resistance protein, MATE family